MKAQLHVQKRPNLSLFTRLSANEFKMVKELRGKREAELIAF